MTKLSTIFVCFLLFLSCTSNTILEPPKDLIPKEKMISIFVDLHLAQAGANIKNLKEKRNENYFQLVYDKYQIDTIKFNESNEYYASLIDEYHAMFVEVEDRLTKLQEQYMEQRDLEDSLKRDQPRKLNLPEGETLEEIKKRNQEFNRQLPVRKDSMIG